MQYNANKSRWPHTDRAQRVQYYVRFVSESWLHSEAFHTLSFKNLVLPMLMPPHTELLDLDPLPLSALGNAEYEAMYKGRFTHFNPIQVRSVSSLCLIRVDV